MQSATFSFEKPLWDNGLQHIIGIDEVGRGCFAGPVVAAGVIFPIHSKLAYHLYDSKKLLPKKRIELTKKIQHDALAFSIALIATQVINKEGIGKATQSAFQQVIKSTQITIDHILIDGFKIQSVASNKQTPIIKGDSLSISIAAASILAKVYRDSIMEELSQEYPEYQFGLNKGYGTKQHREAIAKYGLSNIHRTSFDIAKYAHTL